MQSPNLNQSHGLPFCPACQCAHHPATNGAGYKVWCNGARVETDEEQLARETLEAENRARRAAHRARVEAEYKEGQEAWRVILEERAARAEARARARAVARCIAQAERAARPYAPAIEPWEAATLPGGW